MGHHVEAVDRDAAALTNLQGLPNVSTRLADLESEPWPYGSACFDGVIVTNYLYRPRFSELLATMKTGGVLIYETFMAGNETLGKPSNPNFLLQPGELLERVQPHATVIAFEQGRIEQSRPAFVQRICARMGSVDLLPS